MKKIVLNFIGTDSWSRPVFEDEKGKLFKDTNCGHGRLDLCTAYGFDGEPDTPIRYIEKYKNIEIEIKGMEDLPTEEEKFNYQMLSRLQSDCNYYLGNGNRYKGRLWAGDEAAQIEKMKEIYNWFDEDKKPEWLTWDEILNYENEMTRAIV